MYIYMDMIFNSELDCPDFGSIKLYYTGTRENGFLEIGNKKFRKYTLLKKDILKLSLITNAAIGSIARVTDSG